MRLEAFLLHQVATSLADHAAAVDERITQYVYVSAITQHRAALHNLTKHRQAFINFSYGVQLTLPREEALCSIKDVQNSSLAAWMYGLEYVQKQLERIVRLFPFHEFADMPESDSYLGLFGRDRGRSRSRSPTASIKNAAIQRGLLHLPRTALPGLKGRDLLNWGTPKIAVSTDSRLEEKTSS